MAASFLFLASWFSIAHSLIAKDSLQLFEKLTAGLQGSGRSSEIRLLKLVI